MTSHLLVKNCDGGHICHPPKECCKQGCCYLDNMSVYRPPPLNNSNMFPPVFVGHWYFWAAITATLAGILCACSLWRRNSSGGGSTTTAASAASASGFGSLFCCSDGEGGARAMGDEGASEPDSNGSCYAPPQYSRCSSFHQAPPPYTEVTSKPDLYPLVIGYSNRDTVLKANGPSTGYLMVQYFRNFIARPVGSLSATSTIDSLSSSFIFNAANEANTIIPPTYSCMGSLEEVRTTTSSQLNCTPTASVAPLTATTSPNQQLQQHTFHELPAVSCTNLTTAPTAPTASGSNCTCVSASPSVHSLRSTVSRKSPTTVIESSSSIVVQPKTEVECHSGESSLTNTLNKTSRKLNRTRLVNRSVDSDEDHNFSDLLNLSVCLPTHGARAALLHGGQHDLVQMQNSYSVANSMTSSDISSLANLGSPDSPPRATSPTLEMKELLDKIQQLPQQRSPVPVESVTTAPSASTSTTLQQVTSWSTSVTTAGKVRGYFHRSKAKTMYMPLYEGPTAEPPDNNTSLATATTTIKGNGTLCHVFGNINRGGWLSRSAPNTPCGTFAPTFPNIYHKPRNSVTNNSVMSSSRKGSKSLISDGSPLLDPEDEEDEEGVDQEQMQRRTSTNSNENL